MFRHSAISGFRFAGSRLKAPRNDGQRVSSLRGGTTKQSSEKKFFKSFDYISNNTFYQ